MLNPTGRSIKLLAADDMKTKLMIQHPRGRLSFGSFMEIVSILAIVNGALPLVVTFVALFTGVTHVSDGVTVTHHPSLDLGEVVFIYLGGVVSVLCLGGLAFPLYCIANHKKRTTGVTVIIPDADSGQQSHGETASKSAPEGVASEASHA